MKLIPTTATVVENIKASAKAIKLAIQIPHLAALEQASTEAGYESWFHVRWCIKQSENDVAPVDDAASSEKDRFITEAKAYMAYLAKKGVTARVTPYPAKGDVFHEVEIEGVCFRGAVGIDGPAIIRRSARLRGYEQGWVQLGAGEIHHVPLFSPYIARAKQDTPIGHEWWICKYGPREERVKIDDLSPVGRHALAHEFGIVLRYSLKDSYTFDADPDAMHYFGGDWILFYLSPAFKSLCEWAKKRPRKARNCPSSHLGDWATSALARESVLARY